MPDGKLLVFLSCTMSYPLCGKGSYTWGMAMGTTFAIRNSLRLSRARRNDSQGCKCKGLSVFSHPLALCRRTACIADFSLLTCIADQNGAAQGDSPYVFGQSFTTAVYRSIGHECRPTKILTWWAGSFSILGRFSETLNRRAYCFRGSDCSV